MLRDVEYFGALGHITNRCTRLLRARLFNVAKLACGVFATANVALQAPYQRVSSSVRGRSSTLLPRGLELTKAKLTNRTARVMRLR